MCSRLIAPALLASLSWIQQERTTLLDESLFRIYPGREDGLNRLTGIKGLSHPFVAYQEIKMAALSFPATIEPGKIGRMKGASAGNKMQSDTQRVEEERISDMHLNATASLASPFACPGDEGSSPEPHARQLQRVQSLCPGSGIHPRSTNELKGKRCASPFG